MSQDGQTYLVVMRDCCTSGQCDTCKNLTPFGKPARVEHARYTVDNRARADLVASKWASHNAKVEERAS